MEKVIKIGLSLLLFGCLLKMSYGYYQLVRFIAMVSFFVLAYQSYKNEKEGIVFIYVILALLFQPFIKIALGRVLWNLIDVVVAFGLIISLFKLKKIE